jgi:NitT/TauT family transport system substrate-binding protein
MRRFLLALALCAGLAACAAAGAQVHPAKAVRPHAAKLRFIRVATGFFPNVIFAPYYVAQDKGFYRAAGLNVQMNYDRVPDLLQAVARNKYFVATSSGDSVAIARAAGTPITFVMAQYQKYPVGAMWLKDGGPNITKPSDLKGKNIGFSIPGSSTFFGLEALLHAGGLTDSDVKETQIGFTETEALLDKRVDVAMTFIDNEPVQAAALGHPVNTMAVSQFYNLVGNGLVTSTSNVKTHPKLLQAFVTATLKGLRYTLQHPEEAFQISLKRMPDLVDPKQIDIQRQVLNARLTFQQPPKGHPLGWSNPANWTTTVNFLKSISALKSVPATSTLYTNKFAEAAKA